MSQESKTKASKRAAAKGKQSGVQQEQPQPAAQLLQHSPSEVVTPATSIALLLSLVGSNLEGKNLLSQASMTSSSSPIGHPGLESLYSSFILQQLQQHSRAATESNLSSGLQMQTNQQPWFPGNSTQPPPPKGPYSSAEMSMDNNVAPNPAKALSGTTSGRRQSVTAKGRKGKQSDSIPPVKRELSQSVAVPPAIDSFPGELVEIQKKGSAQAKNRRSSVMSTLSQVSEMTEDGQGTGKKRSRNKSSNYRGVSRCAKDGRWQARIRIGREVMYLGRFKTELDAAKKYDEAAKEHHGVRAVLNFGDSADPQGISNDEDESTTNPSSETESTKPSLHSKPSDVKATPVVDIGEAPKKRQRRSSAVPKSAAQKPTKTGTRRNSTPPIAESMGSSSLLQQHQQHYQQIYNRLQQEKQQADGSKNDKPVDGQENLQPLWANFSTGQSNPFLLGLTTGMLGANLTSPYMQLHQGRHSSQFSPSNFSEQPSASSPGPHPKSPTSDMRGAISGLISLNSANV